MFGRTATPALLSIYKYFEQLITHLYQQLNESMTILIGGLDDSQQIRFYDWTTNLYETSSARLNVDRIFSACAIATVSLYFMSLGHCKVF